MKNTLKNMEEILSQNVSGFHQYILKEPFRLGYVSKNLCDMTGFSEKEFLDKNEEKYMEQVYSADRERYSSFLHKLSLEEQTLTLQYRLVKKDGSIIYVNDTVNSKLLKDGTMVGYSVLTDITEVKNENNNLQFLNETIPCGFLKYTCEKQPKITYINKQMLEFLRFPEVSDGELDYFELCKDNIYLMIPAEERRRFAIYLDRVYKKGAPIAGEMVIQRCDGTKAYLFGWVTKCTNEQGIEEFQSACMDITERHYLKKERETKRYLKALTDVYDLVFEFDNSENMVKCLYSQPSSTFKNFENIPMQMDDAIEKWMSTSVYREDRKDVRAFFKDYKLGKLSEHSLKPPQIKYRALSSSGRIQTYSGIFLKINSSTSLFCSRKMPDDQETSDLRIENVTLKNMQELVMRFTEGIVAFEVQNGIVKPLYTSDNVCNFFGYTKDKWIFFAENGLPIKDFISQSGIDYEDVEKLFATGESEFTYFDMTQNSYRRIKAICSKKNLDEGEHCYIMLYNLDGKGIATSDVSEKPKVLIRTFGYFDVFVGEKPIAFRSEKSKELFALLVDRRGGFVSSEEAISFLWEDEPINTVTLARYRKVALRLKNILEEYGISDVVESVDGKRRIVTEKVKCDLYDYLSGKEEHRGLFKGSYLTNYSWGENTLGELTGDIVFN
ncbi:MAG: PAS domain-containing protein [Clostridia bacterium]|nr:PAS domain-containing protein [Clostridia bacterium]